MTDKEILDLSKTPEMQEKIKNQLLKDSPLEKWKDVWKSMGNCEKIDFVRFMLSQK
jgi:hypothetical protein